VVWIKSNDIKIISLFIKQGKEIPKIGDEVGTTFDNGIHCKFIVLSIENVQWNERLLLKINFKIKVLEATDKQEKRNGFRIVK
jgi:hypothetical protein